MVVSRWQVEGGMWSNCLGAVRKAGISSPTLLCDICVAAGSGGKFPDIAGGGGAGAAGVLSTFYVLIMI